VSDGERLFVTTRFFTPPIFFPPSPTLTTVKIGDGGRCEMKIKKSVGS
jgi:hypothetical protein